MALFGFLGWYSYIVIFFLSLVGFSLKGFDFILVSASKSFSIKFKNIVFLFFLIFLINFFYIKLIDVNNFFGGFLYRWVFGFSCFFEGLSYDFYVASKMAMVNILYSYIVFSIFLRDRILYIKNDEVDDFNGDIFLRKSYFSLFIKMIFSVLFFYIVFEFFLCWAGFGLDHETGSRLEVFFESYLYRIFHPLICGFVFVYVVINSINAFLVKLFMGKIKGN